MQITLTVANADDAYQAVDCLTRAFSLQQSIVDTIRKNRDDVSDAFVTGTGHRQTPLTPAQVFASSVHAMTQSAEGAAVAPTPLPSAPSTAGVEAPPTAPVEQPASSLPPPPVATPPAPTGELAATAPTNAVVPTIPANGVDLDAEGLPWDARIHAGSKTKTQKGLWVAKRGLNDAALVARVKAELLAVQAIPVPAAPPGLTSPEQVFADGKAQIAGGAAVQIPLPPAASVVEPPAVVSGAAASAVIATPPSAPTSNAPVTFQDLLPRVTDAMVSRGLPGDALMKVTTELGLPQVPALGQRPDLVPVVWATLQQQYPGVVV